MGVEFLIWSNSTTSRQKTFDCKRCISSKSIDQKVCYLYGDEEQDILFVQPVIDDGEIIYDKGDKKNSNVEELFEEILPEIMVTNDDLSAFKALAKTNVCPKGLLTDELGNLLKMEMFCKQYNLPPLGSTEYLDYPEKLVETFCIIDNTRERLNLELLKEKQDT